MKKSSPASDSIYKFKLFEVKAFMLKKSCRHRSNERFGENAPVKLIMLISTGVL